jgi:hypothetical protein
MAQPRKGGSLVILLNSSRMAWRRAVVMLSIGVAVLALSPVSIALAQAVDHRVLATSKTSTMEKELNEAAKEGFRFDVVMGGETAFGGNEVVTVVSRTGPSKVRFAYRLLATSRTSTMQKEMQEAADEGFEYRGQTVFKTTFGGEEVVCILEKDTEAGTRRFEYRLLATSRTATLQKELNEIGAAGFQIVGMTVAKTTIGGRELVAITRRPKTR